MTIVSRISLIGHSAAAREMERSVATAVATAAKRAIATEVTAGTEEILGLPHSSTPTPSTSSGSAVSAIQRAAEAARDAAERAAEKEPAAATADQGEGGTPTATHHTTTVVQRSAPEADLGSAADASSAERDSGTSHTRADHSGVGSAHAAHVRSHEAATDGSTSPDAGTASAPASASRAGQAASGSSQSTRHLTAVEHAANADAAATEVQTIAQAASVPVMPASPWAILVGFGIVGLGALIAWQMPHAKPIEIGSAMATYGALLVFATAVERLLEPISHWMPGRKARDNYEASVVKVMNGHPEASLNEVAAAHSAVTRAAADRTVLVWGLATAISTVAATATGFYLLRMISAADWHATVPTWVDGFITGLVVGSGTKPLHDLISRAQGSKDPSPPASA